MAKRITDEQILGEKGVNLIQSVVLQMGFTWHPTNQPVEAGIDGWVELRDTTSGEVANFWLAVQSKARSSVREDEKTVKYTCSLRDVEYWAQGNQPVILVLSKPAEGLAWWVSVKDYLRNKDIRKEKTIVFDKERDLLSPATREDWKCLGTSAGVSTYFTPAERSEVLTSNLLKLNRFSPTIFNAVTTAKSGKELNEQLRTVEEWPPREWYFGKGRRLYSFHDLNSSPWNQVCQMETIHSTPTGEIAYSNSDDDRKGFVRLLNGCLRTIIRQHRMRHSREQGCYYFMPNKSNIVRQLGYQSRKKRTSRRVVSRHFLKTDKTKVAYYRHDAFEHRFLRFGESWYLTIEPTYVFTADGYAPDPYREEHLSKIKSLEGDAAVAGKVLMFADILGDKSDLYDDPYPFIGFEGLESATIDVGIDDDAWSRLKAPAPDKDVSDEDFGEGLFD